MPSLKSVPHPALTRIPRSLCAALTLAFGMALGTAPAIAAPAGVPNAISYKGYLTDPSGTAINSNGKTIDVQVFNSASGGSALYAEQHTGVVVTQGRFDLLLGAAGTGKWHAVALAAERTRDRHSLWLHAFRGRPHHCGDLCRGRPACHSRPSPRGGASCSLCC